MYLLNLFIKLIFLFNQTIIEIDTHIKLIDWIKKMEEKILARLHILEILSKNKNKVILKNKVHLYKRLKKVIDESEKPLQKLNK